MPGQPPPDQTAVAPRSRVLHRNLRGGPPPLAVSGHGVWLQAADGRQILDASGGAAVSCLGHGRAVEAVRHPAEALAYAHAGFFSSAPARPPYAVSTAEIGMAVARLGDAIAQIGSEAV